MNRRLAKCTQGSITQLGHPVHQPDSMNTVRVRHCVRTADLYCCASLGLDGAPCSCRGTDQPDRWRSVSSLVKMRFRCNELYTRVGCSSPTSFGGNGMSRWPFLLKYLSYSPVTPFDGFRTWRESADPTVSNSRDCFTGCTFGRSSIRTLRQQRTYNTGADRRAAPYDP
jgi:hypothetical protein